MISCSRAVFFILIFISISLHVFALTEGFFVLDAAPLHPAALPCVSISPRIFFVVVVVCLQSDHSKWDCEIYDFFHTWVQIICFCG